MVFTMVESRAGLPADHQPESKRLLPPDFLRDERRNLGPENGCLSFESLLERLPVDIQDSILERLNFEDLSRTKVVSKLFKDHIDSDEFHLFRGRMRPKEFSLSPLHFSSGKHGIQQFEGYDLISREWKRLPPIPVPDPDLFKDFNICGAGGIMCANVSAPSSMHEKMIVFNPLTGRSRELPPLNHRRTPVLMHLTLNSTEESYKIIVAGSARAGQENLSRVIEIFDSRTSMWTIAQDLPGPLFALNEYQTGVCSNGVLYCIAALEGKNSSKGILAFSVDEGIWLLHLSFPLANSTNSNIVQLVENSGEIFLFSEIEHSDRLVEHRVDLLEGVTLRTDLRSVTNSAQCTGEWRNVMSRLKVGGRSLLVYPEYPEYTCVPFGEGMLCIFNTIVHTGTVYDVRTHGQRIETLPSPSWNGSGERGLYSANPLTFCFEPSFKGKP